MLRTLFSFRGLILAFALVAIGLPVVLVGEVWVVRTLLVLNDDIARIREGQFSAAAALQAQSDEDAGLIAFVATGSRAFLSPYESGRRQLPIALDTLDARLRDVHDEGPDLRAAGDLRRIAADWQREVAAPVLAGRPYDRALALRDRALLDRFRALGKPIETSLGSRYRDATKLRRRLLFWGGYSAAAALVMILILGAVSAIALMRLRRELDEDRAVVDALQNALSRRLVPPPHLRTGTAYRSATRDARAGGDVYDVYRLDDDCTLLVVADVSGKGLTAAVDAMFVRFAVRALASEVPRPDEIAERFDRLYCDAGPAPESFVTLFVGIHDRRSATLRYANAGHEASWIRRPTGLVQLAPTGTLIGIGPSQFGAETQPFGPGDVLVLATDGLTEARDPRGGFIEAARVREWLLEADADDPQRFVDALLARVAAYTHSAITDDLAVLAVTPASETP